MVGTAGKKREIVRRYGDRLGHVHFKDIRPEVLARVDAEGLTFWDAIKADIFCPLVVGLTRNMALDYGPHGIRADVVCPSFIRTRLVQDSIDRNPDPVAAEAAMVHAVALGRIAEPDEGRHGDRLPCLRRRQLHHGLLCSSTAASRPGEPADPPRNRDNTLPAEHPLLFVDHPFPEIYRDLVDGRATLVGLGTDDQLDVADALLVSAARFWNAAAFARSPRAKVISRVGVGYDNVVVADATAAGMTVCNTPIAPMVSAAEHTLALMFAATRHLPQHVARAHQGLKAEPVGRALELDASTLGLIGIGRIASRVAAAAHALGMQVIASDPAVTESPVPGVALVDLDDLLPRSDLVSIHAPALPMTVRMINTDTIARMKQGAYLVNCARGVFGRPRRLLTAIDNGHLAGAGLDVTDPEPVRLGHPLLDRPNVVVTPPLRILQRRRRRRLYEHSINNALAVLTGEPADIVV